MGRKSSRKLGFRLNQYLILLYYIRGIVQNGGHMSMAARIATFINRISILIAISTAIAIFGFGMADWRIGEASLFGIFQVAFNTTLIITFIQDLILKPMFYRNVAIISKQATVLAVDQAETATTGDRDFVIGVIDEMYRVRRTGYILGALAAIIGMFALFPLIADPIIYQLAIWAILMWLPVCIIALLHLGRLRDMKRLDPDLYRVANKTFELFFSQKAGNPRKL